MRTRTNGLKIWLAVGLLVGSTATAAPPPEPIEVHQPKTTPPPWVEHATLFLALGMQRKAATGIGSLPSGRVAWHFGTASGFSLMSNLQLGTGSYREGGEGSAHFFVGYRLGLKLGLLRFYIGPEVGGGLAFQAGAGIERELEMTGVFGVGPYGGASVQLGPRFLLTVEGHCPLLFLTRNGREAHLLLPAAWVGFSALF